MVLLEYMENKELREYSKVGVSKAENFKRIKKMEKLEKIECINYQGSFYKALKTK